MKKVSIINLLLLISLVLSAKVKEYRVDVIKEYPHSKTAYTQGFFFYNDKLFETTGQYGESSLRILDLDNAKIKRQLNFNKTYFVEGGVELKGKIYILTWLNRLLFTYDAESLKYLHTYSFPKEGWGLTTDGKSLIASDGSSKLYFYSPELKLQKQIDVLFNGRKIRSINELEYIDGRIWANVYLTDMILIINPDNGRVEAIVDCTNLLPNHLRDNTTDVLNGIAYNPKTKEIFLTGKNWPRIYKIKLREK